MGQTFGKAKYYNNNKKKIKKSKIHTMDDIAIILHMKFRRRTQYALI